MGEPSEPAPSPADEIARLQAEKLRYETEKLQREIEAFKTKPPRNWTVLLGMFLPMLTILCTVGGFLFGVFQYLHGQQKEREHTVRNQIRADLTEFYQLPTGMETAIGPKVYYLITDLKELTADRPEDFERTSNLMRLMITFDLDLTKMHHRRIAGTVAANWPGWQDTLNAHPDHHLRIVGNYLRALKQMGDEKDVPEAGQDGRGGLISNLRKHWKWLLANPNLDKLTAWQKADLERKRDEVATYLPKGKKKVDDADD